MTRKDWLRGEIAAWREEGLVDARVADLLAARYAHQTSRLVWCGLLSGVLGGILVALGLVAIFAVNWDAFGRAARTLIAVSPVLVCGLLAAVAAARAWRTPLLWEPLGLLWCLSIGAAACLVAQTYNIGGTASALVLFVAALAWPVVLATPSVAAMSLWPLFPIIWTIAVRMEDGPSVALLVLALLFMALSLPAFLLSRRRPASSLARLISGSLTGFVYSFGSALLVAAAIPVGDHPIEAYTSLAYLASLLVFLSGRFFHIRGWVKMPITVAAATSIATPFALPFIFTLAIVLSLAIGAYGIRTRRLSYMNIGTILFLYLVLMKCCFSHASFALKGVVLLVGGISFIALNVFMIRLKKRREGTR